MYYSKLLEEADKANIKYPDLIKPVKVWRIKETWGARGVYSSYYLSFSFVMDKNLKFPELGFNLITNHSLNQRPMCFLTEEDAKQFYNIYKDKAIDLHLEHLEVGGGRGGVELVRISKDGSIPVYGSKASVEYLLKYENNKVPEYVKKRLAGDVFIPDAQKAKDARKEKTEKDWIVFVKNVFNCIRELPGFEKLVDPGQIEKDPTVHNFLTKVWTPHIDIYLVTSIEETPVNIMLQVDFYPYKYILPCKLTISNDYIFDDNVISTAKNISEYAVTDFPILLPINPNNGGSYTKQTYITYKKPKPLKLTATKDQIKDYITTYLDEIHEYIENIVAEEEL